MNRLERLSAILIHLQSKKIITASEMAERFNVSVRTVYRDINALIEAGVPVGAEAGTGYFLVDGYKLPPVMFTTQEATALIIAEKLIDYFPDRFTKTNFHDALFKIKAVLKGQQKDHIELLSENTRIFQGYGNPEQKEYIFLQEVQQAVVNKKAIEISYYVPSREQLTRREVEPLGICFYMNDWHLIAWCRMRNDYRDFRMDRIKAVKHLDENFINENPISIDEYFKTWFIKLDLSEVKISVSKEVASKISNSKYWYGFVKEEIKPDHFEMNFYNHDLVGFAKWLLTIGTEIQIITPPELKEIHRNLISELVKQFLNK